MNVQTSSKVTTVWLGDSPPSRCNAILAHCESPFLAVLWPDDVVLPGALEALVETAQANPASALVMGLALDVDDRGRASRYQTGKLWRACRQEPDPYAHLVTAPQRLGGLRLFRTAALRAMGGFDTSFGRRAIQQGCIDLAGRGEAILLRQVVSVRPPLRRRPRWRSVAKRLQRWLEGPVYVKAAALLAGVPLPPASTPRPHGRRIAYYTWHFPVLSQTFIHREISALRSAGLDLHILAEGAEDVDLADADARQLLDRVTYTEPWDRARLARYRRRFLGARPLFSIRLLAFIVGHRYHEFKSWQDDLRLFDKAMYVAGLLQERNFTHVHSPWADLSAFVALLAARLTGISYSVQARAHDVHRHSYLVALREKFESAEFVVTNTRYNVQHLRTMVPASVWPRVHLIYNGVNLEQFNPNRPPHTDPRFRILCVARLIEQKGLVCLLKAIRRLLDDGRTLQVDIVGAPEVDLYACYHVELKRLHRRLGLAEHVHWLGAMPFEAVLACYQRADLFVLPCVIARDGSRDITPNALIEAMAMGLPVVATTVTGLPEIVDADVNGLLVPPDDPAALADAIARLQASPEERHRLGANARRKVEARFDIHRNIQQYVALYAHE
ncbi:MAG TPA: glycosyltransferase [Candidatus Xenobia bacterium]